MKTIKHYNICDTCIFVVIVVGENCYSALHILFYVQQSLSYISSDYNEFHIKFSDYLDMQVYMKYLMSQIKKTTSL